MKLITWNVNRSSVRRFRRQAAALAKRDADILALTEVGIKAGPRAAELLGNFGYGEVVYSRETPGGEKTSPSGVLLASRFPMEAMARQFDVPEHHQGRVLSARFETPFGMLEGHVVHVPPGSSCGWQKIEVFEALYDRLGTESENPRFLAGDFNSPSKEYSDGRVKVFGSKKEGTRWSDGERSVLMGLADFGLPDAFRAVHGYEKEAWSHKCERKGEVLWRRRFDHVFACPTLRPENAKYLHGLDEHSDHTPLEVVFDRLGAESVEVSEPAEQVEPLEQAVQSEFEEESGVMDGFCYEEDIRSINFNKNGHRRGRFKVGWGKAVKGESYGAEALRRLTWDNLGWRLGKLFGEADEAMIDDMYDWCVRQQAQSGESE